MLELVNISCERAERTLFSELSLQLNAGELVEVRGANGAGKSTLLRIIAGLSQSYTGDILWRGLARQDPSAEFSAHSVYIGHLSGIKPALRPLENLRWLTELQTPFEHTAAITALQRLGLGNFLDLPCHQLSAGQQRRVALARLLTTKSDLWLLDEPFTALDSSGSELLESMLLEHLSAGGCAILSSHQALNQIPKVRRLNL